jgi:hypothetical protein
MGAGRCVYELGVDAQAASAALDTALEEVANLELAAELRCVDVLSLIGERGVAGDDESVRDLEP